MDIPATKDERMAALGALMQSVMDPPTVEVAPMLDGLSVEDASEWLVGAGYELQTLLKVRGDACWVFYTKQADGWPAFVTLTGGESYTVAQYEFEDDVPTDDGHEYDRSCRCALCYDETVARFEDAQLRKAGL